MTLRILFTLAILAGLATAPNAQTFRWEPNSREADVSRRVERALERARRQVERRWERIDRQWRRSVERAFLADRLRAAEIVQQVGQRVARQVNSEVWAATRGQFDGRDSYGNHLQLERIRLYETPNCWADALRSAGN